MKQLVLLALALATAPVKGNERPPDPIAWKCYMCTPEEREAVALGKGEGEHYVYNSLSRTAIYGYRVTGPEGLRSVEEFTPAPWIREQYSQYIWIENSAGTELVDSMGTVKIYAPGSPHVRSDMLLWGHHTSALNPVSEQARELARRVVTARARWYVQADTEHGRMLRLEPQLKGLLPLIFRLNLVSNLGEIEYYFDYDTRRWEFLESWDYYNRIQERREDFLGANGEPRVFRYPATFRGQQPEYFVKRAQLAGVSVRGAVPPGGHVEFHCSAVLDSIQCNVQ